MRGSTISGGIRTLIRNMSFSRSFCLWRTVSFTYLAAVAWRGLEVLAAPAAVLVVAMLDGSLSERARHRLLPVLGCVGAAQFLAKESSGLMVLAIAAIGAWFVGRWRAELRVLVPFGLAVAVRAGSLDRVTRAIATAIIARTPSPTSARTTPRPRLGTAATASVPSGAAGRRASDAAVIGWLDRSPGGPIGRSLIGSTVGDDARGCEGRSVAPGSTSSAGSAWKYADDDICDGVRSARFDDAAAAPPRFT